MVEYANLKAGGNISTTLQVNDLASCDAPPGAGYASGSQDANIELTFDAEEVVLPIVDKVVEEPTAPQTFDAGIVTAVAMIVSATGYVLSKKR